MNTKIDEKQKNVTRPSTIVSIKNEGILSDKTSGFGNGCVCGAYPDLASIREEQSADGCQGHHTKWLSLPDLMAQPQLCISVLQVFQCFIDPKNDHCLVLSLSQSMLLLNFVQIGFVKFVTWISLCCKMDLSKLIYRFL